MGNLMQRTPVEIPMKESGGRNCKGYEILEEKKNCVFPG